MLLATKSAPTMIVKRSLFLDLAAFFLPILMLVEFRVIGQLFLGEILIIISLPFILGKLKYYTHSKYAKLLITIYLFWTLSLVFTDIYRQSAFVDYSRGWSKQVFTAANTLMFLFLFRGSAKRIPLALAGLGIFYIFNGSQAYDDMPQIWKFGAGQGLAILTMSIISIVGLIKSVRVYMLFNFLLLFGFGVVSISLNSRSGAGIFLLASLSFMILYFVQKPGKLALQRSSFTKISVGSSILVLLLLTLYNTGAPAGWFGDEAQVKYEKQYIDGYGPFGILIGGRTEVLVALNAIKDSPFIGHGSWARDIEYRIMLLDFRKRLNNEITNTDEYFQEDDYIPSHSHLLGAWVQGGIMGAAFWVVILLLFVKLIKNWTIVPWRLQPVTIYLIAWASWDIMFSPFGGERRLFWGIILAVLLLLLSEVETLRRRAIKRSKGQVMLGNEIHNSYNMQTR